MNATAPKTTIKLSDITGPYPLLGAFLLIVESLLGFWLIRADTAIERIVAGVLMTLILAGFLFVLLRLQKERLSVPDPPNLPGKLTAATEVATKQEIEAPEPQKIAGPDRSYLINKPPTNWVTRELTLAEFLGERMKLDPTAGAKLFGAQPQSPDILVFKSSSDTIVIPNPGKTTTDGRMFPTALTSHIPTQLSILPMERYASPLFVERPLLHNFLAFIGQVATIGTATLRELRTGILPNTERRYFQAELRQETRNVTVNGREELNLDANTTVIAIEGELRDHLLVMNYASLLDSSDPQLDRDLKDLLSLASSFKPLEITDSRERKKQIKEKIDKEFSAFLEAKKEDVFFGELSFAILRFNEDDMANAERRNEAIKVLKPFEAFAKELNLQSDLDLDKLWTALLDAEQGNATDFKSLFLELRQDLLSEIENNQKPEEESPKALPEKDEGDETVSLE